MKILQEPHFQPITLVLESAEEAHTFWGVLQESTDIDDAATKAMASRLSDWLSTEAHL
jgi:hypothetical protein